VGGKPRAIPVYQRPRPGPNPSEIFSIASINIVVITTKCFAGCSHDGLVALQHAIHNRESYCVAVGWLGTATKSQVRMERTPTARTTCVHRKPRVNFEEITTLRVLLRFLRWFPSTRVFRGRLAHFLGLFSTANQDQFGYPGVWCVPS